MTEKDFIIDELTTINGEYLSKIIGLEAKEKQTTLVIADLNKDLIYDHERMGDRLKSAEKKQPMTSIESDEEDICKKDIYKSNHRDQNLEYDMLMKKTSRTVYK